MKGFYTFIAAACVALAAHASPRVLTAANGDIIEPDVKVEMPRTLQKVSAPAGPSRAKRLNPADLSGTYIDSYSVTYGGDRMSHSVIVRQEGTKITFDGIAGFGQENLSHRDDYEFISPIVGEIDIQTGKINVKAGQRLAKYEDTTFDNLVPYIGNFVYTDNGSLRYGNYTCQWAHVEGDRIVFDVNPVFLAFSGSVPGSVSNSPFGGEYGSVFDQANGLLSYLATDKEGNTDEYTTGVHYEYTHDADGNRMVKMSSIFAENGAGYNIVWNIDSSDPNTMVATRQLVWGNASSPYYLTAISNRGGRSQTVAADITERHLIKWPIKYKNTQYISWAILNSVTGDYISSNEPATVTGEWYQNYPELCILNDQDGWNPADPRTVTTTTGIYEFEIPAGVNEFAISTERGTNSLDMGTFESAMLVPEMLGDVTPGQKYFMIYGSNIDEDVVVLPEHENPVKVYLDIDFLEMWVEMQEPARPTIGVTFEGFAAPQMVEADQTTGIFSFNMPAGTVSFALDNVEGQRLVVADDAKIADNTGATEYALVEGDGTISVAYTQGEWTIYVDLENAKIWGINATDAPAEGGKIIFWDNTESEFENPYVHYSLDYGATFEEPVAMELVESMVQGVSASESAAAKRLYRADISADATHLFFSDGGDEDTATDGVFEAVDGGKYDPSGLTGIESVGFDAASATRATYYTLQGVRVDRPAAGTIVVRVSADGKATKVMIK